MKWSKPGGKVEIQFEKCGGDLWLSRTYSGMQYTMHDYSPKLTALLYLTLNVPLKLLK